MTVQLEPGCFYWPTYAGSNAAFAKHDELCAKVKAVAAVFGWQIEAECGSGAWLWSQKEGAHARAAYATPEWEGSPQVMPFEEIDGEGSSISYEQLRPRLIGDLDADALEVVRAFLVNVFRRA